MPAGGWSEQGTPPPTTALQPTALLARLYSLCSVDFLPPSYSLDGRFEGPTPFIGQLASAPRCAATSLLLRSCTVVLTIKRWDAPRPVSLTRGFKGHTPFIRPVFETASAASCLCHQVRLGLLSGWTMNTWSRFARQKIGRVFTPWNLRRRCHVSSPQPWAHRGAASASATDRSAPARLLRQLSPLEFFPPAAPCEFVYVHSQ